MYFSPIRDAFDCKEMRSNFIKAYYLILVLLPFNSS
jgi:hypothetical protein